MTTRNILEDQICYILLVHAVFFSVKGDCLVHFVTDKVALYGEKEEKQRPANAPLVNLSDADILLSSENSARRCNSKGRGTIYNPVLGICCHFCRFIFSAFFLTIVTD